MTDREILDEVYRRLVDEKQKYHTVLPSPIISFIEQEWQKADDEELVGQYNRHRRPENWIKDIRELERYIPKTK